MRVNGKIRAREVRVIGPDGKQLGVFLLNDALNLEAGEELRGGKGRLKRASLVGADLGGASKLSSYDGV